jgi:hypothetical protein
MCSTSSISDPFEEESLAIARDHRTAALAELGEPSIKIHPADRIDRWFREFDVLSIRDQQGLPIGKPGQETGVSRFPHRPGVTGGQIYETNLDFQDSLRSTPLFRSPSVKWRITSSTRPFIGLTKSGFPASRKSANPPYFGTCGEAAVNRI